MIIEGAPRDSNAEVTGCALQLLQVDVIGEELRQRAVFRRLDYLALPTGSPTHVCDVEEMFRPRERDVEEASLVIHRPLPLRTTGDEFVLTSRDDDGGSRQALGGVHRHDLDLVVSSLTLSLVEASSGTLDCPTNVT